MPITITADSVYELPEALRQHAKTSDSGKLTIESLPEGFSIENVAGLRRSLGSERSVAKTLRDKLREFGYQLSEDGTKWESEGMDPASARAAVEAIESGSLKSPKEIDDFKAELKRRADAEVGKANAAKDSYLAQLRETLIEREAAAAFTKHGGADALRLLMPIARQAAKVEQGADGKLRTVIYGEDGKQRFDASGAPMNWDDWVQELRGSQDMKPLFRVKETGGAGSASQSGGSAKAVRADLNNLSGSALLALANEKSQ